LRANSGSIIHQQILHGDLEIGVCSSAPSPSSMLYAEPYIPLKLIAFAAKNHPVRKENLRSPTWNMFRLSSVWILICKAPRTRC
jgi:hypothetical protein